MKRFQWKLRTLLLFVIVVSVGLGLFARDRNKLLSRAKMFRDVTQIGGGFAFKRPEPSWFSSVMTLTGVPDTAFRIPVKLVFEPTSRTAHLVNDDSLVDIQPAFKLFPELKTVVYHECPAVTDATLDAITSSKYVKSIDIRGTSISKSGVDRLQDRFPDLEVTFDAE